jgi:acetylornithine deacetylase/succinyl-diaminopimelate desuccinylase-like protein
MTSTDPVNLLAQLVAIDSSNPDPGEQALAEFVDGVAREWGFESRIVETAPGRCNLLVRIDAGRGSGSLGLCAHLDTKPVGDALAAWDTPPLQLVVEGDLGYGLGTSDMKGAIAAMLMAAKEWSDVAESGRLELILTADEEAGSELGAKALASRRLVDVEAILVGEPSGIDEPWEAIFVVSRGICCFDVVIEGTQGHSAISGRLPTSATVAAARAVLALDGLELRHPVETQGDLGPTMNAGVRIEGGVFYGVHPGMATVASDIRTVPGMTRSVLKDDLLQVLHEALPSDVRWTIRFREDQLGWIPAVSIDPGHRLVRSARQATADVLGRDLPLATYPGGSDAGPFIDRLGIPTLTSLGPGWLSKAHGPNECVGLSQVRDAAEIYRRIAAAYLAPHNEEPPA